MKSVRNFSFGGSGFFLTFTGAALYVLAYDEPKFFWPLGLVALVHLFLALEKSESLKEIFKYGAVFGVISVAGALIWFWGAYPLDWLAVSNNFAGFMLTLAVWLSSSVFLGLFFGLWTLVYGKLKRRNFSDAILAPSLWVVSEYLRSFAFSIFAAGKESLIGPYWTFGFLGYPLIWSGAFSFLAKFGGVYLLSFTGVIVNWIVFKIILSERTKILNKAVSIAAFLSLLLIAGALADKAVPNESSPENSAKVAVVSTNLPPRFSGSITEIINKAETIKKALINAAKSESDIIVLPEGSSALSYVGSSTVKKILGDKNILLVDSSASRKNGGYEEEMLFYNPSKNEIQTSVKRFLVPYGEYLPYHTEFIADFFGMKKWVSAVNDFRSYKKGDEQKIYNFGKNFIGALFCSEILPEEFYRNLSRNGAGLLINASSQAIFRGNGILYNQTISLAKMKAASNGRYFVASGNFVPSFILDNRGKIIGETKKGKDDVLIGNVKFIYEKTPYTKFGDWIVLVSAIAALALFAANFLNHWKKLREV